MFVFSGADESKTICLEEVKTLYFCCMIYDSIYAAKVAEILLKTKAVLLSVDRPFTWASGWKSPIYCDNRKLLSYPSERKIIVEGFMQIFKHAFSQATKIAGVATAGIPWASMIAERLDLPMVYVRPAPKDHGLQNQIEGEVFQGEKVLVVEDLISTGKSSLQVVDVLREAGVEVIGMMATFTYAFPVAEKNFEEKNCVFYTLTDYPSLIEKAVEMNYINMSYVSLLNQWRQAPEKWGI